MSVGLDTNILLRYVQEDDDGQSPLAVACIERRCSAQRPGLVSLVVAVELWWSMRRGLRVPVEGAAAALEALLENPNLSFASENLLRSALDAQSSGDADFPGYLIGALNREAGAETTYTFDKAAARHADFTLLTAGAVGATS